jgi:hypothetical protein
LCVYFSVFPNILLFSSFYTALKDDDAKCCKVGDVHAEIPDEMGYD